MSTILSIAAAFLYLLFSVGIDMNVHFCFDRVKDIQFYSSTNGSCYESETAHRKMPCCEDEHISVKIKDQHTISNHAEVTAIQELTLLFASFLTLKETNLSAPHTFHIYFNKPPPLLALIEKAFLFNLAFQLYE